MLSCLVTPRWAKTAGLWFTFMYVCKNKHSDIEALADFTKSIYGPGTRAGFQLPVSLWIFTMRLLVCVSGYCYSTQIRGPISSTLNHCYLLILIYSNGSDNQKLIKHCVLSNDGTGKVFSGHKTFHIQTELFTWLTGNNSSWLEGTHLHITGEWEYRQGFSWRCWQILSSSGAILLWAKFPSGSLMVDSGNCSKKDVKSENVQLDNLESNRKPILCCASCGKGKIYRSILSVT